MQKDTKTKLFSLIILLVDLLFAWLIFRLFTHGASFNVAIFNPKGIIAAKERDLIVTAVLLMCIVVIPVFVFTAYIVYKFRASSTKAEPVAEAGHQPFPQLLIWLPPSIIIFIIAGIVWQSTHALDPHKPLVSGNAPMSIEVVALRWKWLFIYPDQKIATVNFLEFPAQTPVTFNLTADNAAMNSFWIPQIGGQMYAMTGMSNNLHLMANEVGDYQGSTAEMSGPGFSGMRFTARAVSKEDFNAWVKQVQASGKVLSDDEYNSLIQPSENTPPTYYSSVNKNMYYNIVMKYMAPQASQANQAMPEMQGMDMK